VDALKVGVLGLGVAAQVIYLPLLARRRDMFQVSAVCDLDREHAETFGREIGVPAYDNPVDMLDKGGFEAVLVLTPGSHGTLVRAALERGYRVLCEKPLAYSQAEVRDLPGADRLMVAYMKQYDPAAQRMIDCLHEAGGPESVRHLDITVLHPSNESQLLFAHARTSRPAPERLAPFLEAEERAVATALGTPSDRLRRLYAHVLMSSVCHELSLIRLITGPPATVDHVALWPRDALTPSVEVSGSLAQGDRGRYGLRWHYLPSYSAYHETVTVHHEHGSLELHFPSPYLLNAPTRLTVRSRVGTTERTTAYRDVAEAFERQLIAFHRFATQDEPPLTGLEGARQDIVTAQRVIRRYAESAGIPVGGECAKENVRAS
jgi:predicted dehydrogenase